MTNQGRILIVDDDVNVRKIINRQLTAKGFICTEAVDGQAGLELLQKEDFDVALTDIRMPRMDGFELLKAVRGSKIRTLMIVLSHYGEIPNVVEAMNLGAFDFVEKPSSREDLQGAIERAMLHRHVERYASEMADLAEHWEGTFNASPDLLIALDSDQKILRCNTATIQTVGVEEKDLIGRYSHEIICGEEHAIDACPLWKRIDHTQTKSVEIYHPRWKGYYEVSLVPTAPKNGRASGYIFIGHNITERKKMEEALTYERDLLCALMDNIPDCIYFKDANGRFIRVNKAVAQIAGFENPSPMQGMFNSDIFNEFYAKQADQDEQEIIKTGESLLGIEEKEIWIDGREIWVSSTKLPLKNEEGKVVGTICISRDITERKLAEEEFARLATAIEQATETIVITDIDGTIQYVNPAFTEITGYERDEAIGENPSILKSGKHDSAFYQDLWTALERGEVWSGHFVNKRKDGTLYEEEATISPVRDERGEITNYVSVKRDVTKQLKAEKDLRRANAENEMLLASISSILIGVDKNGIVTQWNKVAAQTFGISSSKVIGVPFSDCGIQWDWTSILSSASECMNLNRPVRMDDVAFTNSEGRDRVLGITINPLARESGSNNGFMFLAADITERRILETQLSQSQKLESIGQLAAGIAHEINTPTQYVGDNTRFLQDSFQDLLKVYKKFEELVEFSRQGTVSQQLLDEVNKTLEEVDMEYLIEEIPKAIQQSLEGVERVAKIVRAMKEFSHPGSEKTAVDINRAIESTVTVARNEWKYVAEMVMDLDPSIPSVPCLPGEFNQVILNIVINAAHAIGDVLGENSQSKGTITITTRQVGDWLEIRIADTGSGIPEQARPKVFDHFFTTKEVGRGTGQGLSIAHSVIVNKHGGTIDFETEVGKGTTFIICLPVSE